jgi:hypothetical protein
MCVRMKYRKIEFYALEFDEVVLGLVKKLIRLVNVFDLAKLLMEKLSCKGSYYRDRYQSYYEGLLNYFKDFTLLFRLLSEDNSRYVPLSF